MKRQTKAALTLYSNISFGTSLDDMVDFLNHLKFRKQEFVYQELMYHNPNITPDWQEPTKNWLDSNVPNYEKIISFFKTLSKDEMGPYLDTLDI